LEREIADVGVGRGEPPAIPFGYFLTGSGWAATQDRKKIVYSPFAEIKFLKIEK
jgi:hypothetical protein